MKVRAWRPPHPDDGCGPLAPNHESDIVVLACLHQAQDPQGWRRRIRRTVGWSVRVCTSGLRRSLHGQRTPN